MTKEKNNEDLQKKYLEFQILVNQINQLQQQIVSIQNQLIELRDLKENLSKLKDIKEGTESYVPLSSNIFIKSKIIDKEELLVGVGSNVLLPKTLDETTDLIDKQSKDLEQFLFEMENQISALDLKGQELQKQLSESTQL